jgi:peptide/nickel transport system ATP-binding protein
LPPRFELRRVSKSYHKKRRGAKKYRFPVLNALDLSLAEKTVYALVGDSGCGKSTLAKILMRLESFDEGEFFYRGKPVYSVPVLQFRTQNRIMFQSPLLSVNPCFTSAKIISEPLVIAGMDKLDIKDKLRELTELLELPFSSLEKYPHELSGGELQRVVLARTLGPQPQFIILDEPFSALDEIAGLRLIRLFKTIFRNRQIGVLFISHNTTRVHSLADHVLQMKEGRIFNG